jgi:hypothetical protein
MDAEERRRAAAAADARRTAESLDSVARRLAATGPDSATVVHLRAALRDAALVSRAQLELPAPAHLDSAAPALDSAAARLTDEAARLNAQAGRLITEAARLNAEAKRQLAFGAAASVAHSSANPPLVPGLPSDASGFPTAAALRTLVGRHFPQALAGTMGPKPFVWLALDATGQVTDTAIGPAGLAVRSPHAPDWRYDPANVERVAAGATTAARQLTLDREAVRRRFPNLPDARVGSYSWTHVDAGPTSVQVILVAPESAAEAPR